MTALLDRMPAFVPDELVHKLRHFSPRSQLGQIIQACFAHLPVDLAGELLERIERTCVLESSLAVVVFRTSPYHRFPFELITPEDHGIVSRKVITTAGVNFLVDAWQGLQTLSSLKYHAIGTSTTAEATSDTGCIAEIASATYKTGSRATGTLEEGATSNIFRSAGTNQVASAQTITEHGLMSVATRGSGTCFDRSEWAGTSLSTDDAILTRYDMTAIAGG